MAVRPQCQVLPRSGSTNDDVRALGAAGAPHGSAVIAWEQTHGRGRLGRTWESDDNGNVYLSVLIRCALPPAQTALVGLAAAVATAEACGPSCRIKWPNDVLDADGRKLAGILAEADWSKGVLQYLVIGVGVNHSHAPLPTAAHLGRDPAGREAFARDLVARLLGAVDSLVALGPAPLLRAWRARTATIGRAVSIGAIEGVALDIGEDGALLVRDTEGTVHRVLAGDVHLVG